MPDPGPRWLALAGSAAPELTLAPVELIEIGWDSRVLRALDQQGRRWIFRFPRRADVLPDVTRERTVLRQLRGRLPVAVPDWQIFTRVPTDASGTPEHQLVIGYPELPGHPAGVEPGGDGVFELAITSPPPPRYAASLGAALAALHAADPGSLPFLDAATLRSEAAAVLGRVRQLDPPVVLSRHWQRWIEDDSAWRYRTTLHHGDVHPGHTMVEADGAVVGIIDWTDAGIGDPAADFVDARHVFGAGFGAELLARYGAAGGDPAGLSDRIVARQSFAVAGAALFGSEHDRPDLVRRARQRFAIQAARLNAGLPPV